MSIPEEKVCLGMLIVLILFITFIIIGPTKIETYVENVTYQEEVEHADDSFFEDEFSEIIYVEEEVPYEETEIYYSSGDECYEEHCFCIDYDPHTEECLECECEITFIEYRTETIEAESFVDPAEYPVTYETVNKTRLENRTREVNWILGFEVPWSLHLF